MYLYNKLINLMFSKPKFYKVLVGPAKGIYLFMALRAGLKKYLGIYEKQQTKFMEKVIKEGDYCFDLGSHIGYFTMFFSKLVGEDGRVFSFEPMKEGYEFQMKSIQKNKFKNVTVFNFALGNEEKEQKAYIFSDSGMAHFDRSILGLEESHESDVFQIKTLDSVKEVANLKKLDFVKIDIEGFEYKALLGGRNTVKKHRPNMLIEIHDQKNYKGVYNLLKELDYMFFDLKMNKIDLNTDFDKQVFHIYAKAK